MKYFVSHMLINFSRKKKRFKPCGLSCNDLVLHCKHSYCGVQGQGLTSECMRVQVAPSGLGLQCGRYTTYVYVKKVIKGKVHNNTKSTKLVSWGSNKGTMIPQEQKRKGGCWLIWLYHFPLGYYPFFPTLYCQLSYQYLICTSELSTSVIFDISLGKERDLKKNNYFIAFSI